MPDNGTRTNPFAYLSPEHWRETLAQRAAAREAEKRSQRVLSAYKDLVGSQAFKEVRDETDIVMAEQLNRLIEVAGKCAHCAPIAARIVVLRDIVLRPIQMVWYESQLERLTPDDEITERAPLT